MGSVPKKLMWLVLPLFGANLLQSFYSSVDMLVVGRVVGKTGLAAISNAVFLLQPASLRTKQPSVKMEVNY